MCDSLVKHGGNMSNENIHGLIEIELLHLYCIRSGLMSAPTVHACALCQESSLSTNGATNLLLWPSIYARTAQSSFNSATNCHEQPPLELLVFVTSVLILDCLKPHACRLSWL